MPRIVATPAPPPQPAPKGFAALTRERRAELASQGGRKAQELGTAHLWTSDEARAAGRKGGLASVARRRAIAAGGAR